MTRHDFVCRIACFVLAGSGTACRSILPKADRPVRTLSYPPKLGGHADEIVILLPGRRSEPEEFEQHGLVEVVRAVRPRARVVAVDLHLGYYAARIPDLCLHEEIIQPARQRGERVTLLGVSMGGLGALIYGLSHPQEVSEVLMLAPYIGEEKLRRDIEVAGGLDAWEPGEIRMTSRDDLVKKLWVDMRTAWRAGRGVPMPMRIVTGRRDRHLAINRLFARAFLAPGQFTEIDGGHDWTCWRAGIETLLDAKSQR